MSTKVTITAAERADIAANKSKVSNIGHPLVEKAVPSNAVFTDNNTTYAAGDGLDLSGTTFNVEAASTSNRGGVILSTSTSSTSTTYAATPSAVKSAYDKANAALPKIGGTMTGSNPKITFPTGTYISQNQYSIASGPGNMIYNGYGVRFNDGTDLWYMKMNEGVGIMGDDSTGNALTVNGDTKITGVTRVGTSATYNTEITNTKVEITNDGTGGSAPGAADETFKITKAGLFWQSPGGTTTINNTFFSTGSGNPSSWTFSRTGSGDTVKVNGSLLATGNITANSDLRLKSDLQPIDSKTILDSITGYNYWREDLQERQNGLIAQELREVLPDAVRGKETEEEYLSIAYMQMIPVLVEDNKRLQKEINELKELIKNLL